MKKGVTWFLMTALFATLFLSAGGCSPSGGSAPSAVPSTPAPVVTIETNKGIIKFVTYPDVAPNTVKNFVTLAQKGFYDGLTWHRVEEGFVIQGGDPNGNGSGGPGYSIKAEFGSRKHLDGTVAMARATDPDSAGSQFYICLADQPGLDGKYTVFGQVTEGLDVVHQIAVGDTIIKVTVANADNYPAPEVIK